MTISSSAGFWSENQKLDGCCQTEARGYQHASLVLSLLMGEGILVLVSLCH